ncbi:hypothetical protein N665_0073s0127 [Sinapis alba]|nr:hypothetical protein N665_0073s0127 [Sinapis alba]
MAAFANANTKRYSWWWDSHISPKNSKWLQENLTDMDSKVKQMIKVIEEDADSFARRAEMYYKKRPELMKLVEEFYRAYRALAERYDHATGVIRHAQQTMAEAFPNQDPMMFGEESLVGSSTTEEFDPQTPESYPPIRAPVYPNDLQKGALGISSSHMSTVKRNIAFLEDPQSNGKGFGKARKGLNFNDVDGINGRNAKVLSESERASKAEAEIVALKDALAKVQAEKEASLAQFDQNLERLSNMESEVSRAQEDSRCLNERATRAEAEVETLRETLSKLEVEKESSLLQYQQCLENIADLEERISLAQEEAGEVNERASKAEAEILTLKQSLVGSEADKEAALVQYQQCLETISNLEERLRKAEEDVRLSNQRAENADGEVESLKEKVSKLTQENEAYELQYQQCLETIADLKLKLFHAQEETQRLSREIEDGVAKLKFAEEKCVVLERSNQNLHSELDGLLEKLGNQSHELTEKQKEMGKLWTTVQEEHLRFMEAETAFQTLQQLHSQSQEELSTLALELQNRSQILKDMEARNSGLLEEVQEAKEKNKSLNELNLASAASIRGLQEEVSRLRETIQKLEAEVELRVDQRNALQQEIYCLKEELSQMGKKHQSMVEQVESVGLHPEGFGSSVKELQEENSKLKEIKERESMEKTALLEKLELMEKLVQKNLLLENSISDLNSELETIRGKLKAVEEAFMSLAEEKSGLHSEKNMLVSRLQNATENSKKLSEENRLLENSLFDANAELEELKSKLKSLEDSCHLLSDEKSGLVNERESLLSRMDIMRKSIEDLEKEHAELKVKVMELATERESCLQKIKELGVSLDAKDRDYASFVQLSESRMNGMKSKIYHLQDENQRQERMYQEELDRAHDAHVEIIVLQKCLQDWLEKSSSLVAENQNLKQAAHLLEKLVSELEQENIGTQVQIDSSVDCIKVLRTGICQVLMKLEVIPCIDSVDENSQDQKNIYEILSRLDEMQTMLLKIQRENHQGSIENLVLVEFIRQLKSEAVGIATGKKVLEKELESQRSQLLLSRDEIQKLSNMNGDLTTKVNRGVDREEALKVKIEDVHKQSAIENLVLVEFLKQLKAEGLGIATEKKTLEEEHESQRYLLSLSRDETKKLGYMIRELTTKVNQGVNREEALKVEVDDLHWQSTIENLVLVESLRQLKSGIATEKKLLEEELESQRYQLSFSRDETDKLIYMNGELTTKVNQGINREEVLKVEIEDLHRQTTIENLVLVEFLHQLKSEAVDIATEKKNVEEELESKSYQLSSSRDEIKNLIYMNEELTTKVNQGVNREEVLKVEVDDVHMQSAIENLVLVESLRQLKSEAVCLATEKDSLEEELESKSSQLSSSWDETKSLSYMIRELTTRINQGVNREKVLKVEVDQGVDREEVLKVKIEDVHMQSATENVVLVEFLHQLKLEAVGIATEKKNLEKELESKSCQLLFWRDEAKNLSHMIEDLTTKVNQGVDREEVLKVEVDDLHRQSAIENLVLVEFLRSQAVGIATEKRTLEEELQSQLYLLSFSQDETKKLSHMIEELTTKVNQGVDREEVLKVKTEDVHRQSAIENLILVEFIEQLKSEAAGIATEKQVLEEEVESQSYQLSLLWDETKKLSCREEVLKVEVDDLHMQSAIENLVLVEFLHQLKSEAVCIATEKKNLEEELESKTSQLLFLRDEAKNLSHMIEELTTKVNQGVDREEVLKVEVDDVHMQSAIENLVLVESLRQLKSEAVCIATEKESLEEELESQRSRLSLSRDETQKLIYMNGELTTKVKQGVNREELLNVKIEDFHRQVLQLRNDYTILQGENYKTMDENSYLTKSTLRLEEDISLLLSETIYQSNLILLLEDCVLEKLSEAVKLNEDLDRLSFVKCKLEEEVREFGDELKSTETENLQLESLLEKTDIELLSVRSVNGQLEHEIANVKDQLVQKEKELLEAMLMISIVQSEKSELSKAVEDLECRYKETKAIEEEKGKQVLKLQGDYNEQVKKVGHANEANLKLEADLLNLFMELKGIKSEKEKLNQELSKEKNEVELWESQASTLFGDLQISVVHETFLKGLTHELAEACKNLENSSTLKDVEIDQLNQELSNEKNEVELWESQASTLFGDLQISIVHKTLLEGLIHELAEACKNLEKRSTYKDVEIDQLKGRVTNLEDANKGQEDLMSKYFQAIILLKESIESLEKHIDLEDEPTKDTASNNESFLELEEMCLRIKAIEEALAKKLATEELKPAARRSRRRSGSLRKQNHESEMITKDIVLDQVSDCSSYGISKRDILKIEEDDHSFEVKPQSPPQTGESLSEESLVVDKLEISDRFTDPNKEVNKRKVLERLHSDLQKLSNLHIAVEDLKSKVEKEERSEKGKEDEYETVKGQIHEAEEALEKLLSVNRKLVTKVVSGFEISDGSKSSSVDLDEDERSRRRRISEQARRGSEKIGRLQFEIQRLQFLLLKLEGEREDHRAKAKTSGSKTRTLLKDYIYGGVRGERRKRMKKRFAFCGCVQQPPPSP